MWESMKLSSQGNPFESAQIVMEDDSWRLFFHENPSIVQWEVKLTLFGWKVEEDDENAFLRIIQEVSEETGIVLSKQSLIKVCEDWPREYDKWWFLAHIYYVLVSKWIGDVLAQHSDTQVFNSIKLFEESWDMNWKDYKWTKKLVNNALKLWN